MPVHLFAVGQIIPVVPKNEKAMLPGGPSQPESSNESIPLVASAVQDDQESKPVVHDGSATVLSSSFNLSNTIIGCGIMTLPFNLYNCGWVLGMFCLLLVGLSSGYAFNLLTVASEYTGFFQYRDIALKLYGQKFSLFIGIIVIIYTFGSIASYCIVLRDNMFWWSEPTSENDYKKKSLLWGIMTFIILPLCLLPRIDFLNFTSLVALASIFYVICVVAGFYLLVTYVPGKILSSGPPQALNFSIDAFTAFPLFTTAFCGHYNSMNIYRELKDRSIRRMNITILITMAVTILFNSAMALFGYFAFTDTVASDILRNVSQLSGASVYFQIANTAMILVMLFSYPLVSFGVNKAFQSLIWKPGQKVPFKWSLMFALINVFVPAIIATFVSDIDHILSFTASLCGSPMVYIIPGFFGYTISKRQGGPKYRLALSLILIILGVFYSVSGFSSALYTIAIRPALEK